jgi:hypothetical protein
MTHLRLPVLPVTCILFAASAASLMGCPDSVEPSYYSDEPDAGTGALSVSTVSSASSEATVPATTSTAFVPDGSAAGDAPGSLAPSGPCDLSGRWLVVVRTVTTALGTTQAAHEWYYYEISQSGSQVTVSKGLVCGENVRGLSALSGNADFPKAWPAMMTNLSDTGRTGTSSPVAGGCQVSFEKSYEVMSATVSYYSNFSVSLPTLSEKASGSAPGWQDWDEDGEPGYTMNITGIATGQIYMVNRTWYALSGVIDGSASSFNLAVDWGSDQDVLGLNGPSILSETGTAVKDSDASQHFATLVRLSSTQATGDDASVCTAIRSLAPTLAPSASN